MSSTLNGNLKDSRAVRRLIISVMLIVAIGATAGLVVAATPKKGSSYVGELPETLSRVGKRVVLKVSDKRIGRVRLECGGTRFGLSSKFEISSSGRFTAIYKTGSLLVWRLRGKFTTAETAKAKLYLPAICDGKGGKITLQLAE
jgi:hypothetical protein